MFYGGPTGVDPTTTHRLDASYAHAYANFGSAVAAAGDLDGDGFGDVFVAAFRNNVAGDESGAVYLYRGSGAGVDPVAEPPLLALDAAEGDHFGADLAMAGDIDGDELADLVVGANYVSDANYHAGAFYTYYGDGTSVDPWSEEKHASPAAGRHDQFGTAVNAAGDVDGDGYADALVGCWKCDGAGEDAGAAFVYRGSSTGFDEGRMDVLLAPDAAPDGYFGAFLAAAGDLGRDGYDDILVATEVVAADTPRPGRAYRFYGAAAGIDSGRVDILQVHTDAADEFGEDVAGVGDLDGDGYPDVVVGDVGDDERGTRAGAVYLYFTKPPDRDGDGYGEDVGCDDAEATVYPGATETPYDGVDQDCDGEDGAAGDPPDDDEDPPSAPPPDGSEAEDRRGCGAAHAGFVVPMLLASVRRRRRRGA